MRAFAGKLASLGLLGTLASCGGGSDGGTPPNDVNTMTKNAGDGQTAVVGEAVPVAPSVKITNQNAAGVAGLAVTFTVASGGGQITGGSATTNASGVATVGGWTLGTVAGANTLTATSAGINGSPLTFTVTANAGPPKTLTKQLGDNQTSTPADVVPVKPAVKVADQYGNAVANVTVTFAVASGGGSITGGSATTGADGVATVGNWTLGPNQGANTLTATITGAGVTGNPATFTATGSFVAFNPTSSTTITGNKTYGSVNIPAGVTVTINSDAVITVNGDYTQAGVVTAPCHTLRIAAGGVFTATGNISNVCTDPNADGNDLVLIGQGGYNISNNEIDSSGDIWIMDGPNLALPATTSLKTVRRVSRDVAEAGPYRCRLVNMTLKATPLTKRKAANGTPSGSNGTSGTSRTSGCGQILSGQGGGNLLIDGITMFGGTGGDGGDGTSSTSTPSTGGTGGEPGALNLVSDGDIDIQGTVTLNLGNGGNGGNATSTVTTPGTSATATGGKGAGLKPKNFSSPVTIQSKHGALTIFGTLKVVFGHGGNGGTATASAGTGTPGNPGQKGGDATANGGNGGDAEPFSLVTGGSVTVIGTVDVSGGAGGAGGLSNKTPGAGGAGNVPGATGGPGGNAFGKGGNGGKGQPPGALVNVPPALAASVLTSPGGAAGSATYSGGKGGDGVPNCPGGGGGGGKGGDANGGGGDRGTGITVGALATVTFSSFGNGGSGKAGNGPAGAGGTNATSLGSGASGVPPAPGSFQPGQPGGPCPSTNVIVDLTSATPALNPGVVSPGNYTVMLRDATTNLYAGTMLFAAAGTTFYGSNPARVGWNGAGGSWTADLSTAQVAGAVWTFATWRMCVINTTVNSGNPVTIEQLNSLDVVIATLLVTALTPCVDWALMTNARKLRWRGSGLSSSADANAFGGNGAPPPP